MRLYVSKNEIDALKQALRTAKPDNQTERDKQLAILERVVLCEKLQNNCEASETRK